MKRKNGASGQVVVEMLLILPVFLGMVFTVMEIGNISFQLIVLNHATYEVARIGGMTWTNPPQYACGKLGEIMSEIIATATVACAEEPTLADPQVSAGGGGVHMNHDLVVTGSLKARLIFPISSIILSDAGDGTRTIKAVVRMPIEKPIPR